MADYFGPMIEARRRGNQNRLSILSGALEDRQRQNIAAQQEQRRLAEKQETQRLATAETVRKEAATADDRVAYADILFKARRGDGSFDVGRLTQQSALVPPSLMSYHKQLIDIYTPKSVPQPTQRNIDPLSPAGIAARVDYEKRLKEAGLKTGGTGSSSETGEQYSPSRLQSLLDTQQRVNQTQGRIDTGTYPSYTLEDNWFGAPDTLPSVEAYTPGQLDSMRTQIASDKVIQKGIEDLMAGKNTWEAQYVTEMEDSQLIEEARRLGIPVDSILKGQ